MRLKIRYRKNVHQEIFHEDDLTKLLHLSGGFGSGKTYGLCMKVIKLSILNAPYPGGLVCPTFKEFKKDVLPVMEDILQGNNINYKLHRTDHYFKFPWTRGKLWIESGERRIRGPNWAYAGINELTLMPLVRYREVLGRVRIKGAKFPQIVSSGTPEGMASEYYDVFVDKPWPNSRLIYGDTRDNIENLDSTFIPTIESAFDSVMLDAYMKGLWVNMTGNRFYYSYDPKKNDDPTIEEVSGAAVCCFMDFNVDPMVATLWHYTGDGLIGFKEIVISGTDTTNRMCNALKDQGYGPHRTTIFPDPAGKARSTQGQPDTVILQQHGYEVKTKSAAPSFRGRQLNVNNLLDKYAIRFNPNTMPTLKKDLMAVEQDPLTMEKVKKNPRLTHASDGLDYGCDILFPLSGRRAESRVVKYR